MFFDESIKDVYIRLNSDGNGLSDEEAKLRIKKHGYNEFVQKNKHTALKVFINQFKNFLILLLIGAALISLFVGEHLEFYGIAAIIILTIVLGFIQEYRAEQAMDALEKISAPFATVFRDNKTTKIPSSDLVPGDIVNLAEGDIVPADIRLITCEGLEIDESSLTGESISSKKNITLLSSGLAISDQTNSAFSGTIVTKGSAKGIVFATGKSTEFGKIANTIEQMKDTATPLQIKFEKMAKQLTLIVLGLVAIVFIVSIINMDKSSLDWTKFIAGLFIFSLSLAVAAVPSALAAIVTISLSRGANRLASKNMIIKKLPAAESLGAVTIICSDKTGTLTKNQMTITKILSNDEIIDVTGRGYLPVGEFYFKGKKITEKEINHSNLLFKIGYLCNESKLVNSLTNADISIKKDVHSASGFTDDKWSIIGDPTEGALLVLTKKSGMNEKIIEQKHTKVHELPFDSDRKLMSSIYKNSDNKKTESYVKGAPDFVLKLCTKILIKGKVRNLTPKDRERILKYNDEFAKDALRVLALAYKDVSKIKKYEIKTVEKDLVFVGLVGMIDPPREGLTEALEQCNTAGIKVMMITGDHPTTATAIAKQIGLLKENDRVLTGSELDKLSDEELEKSIENIRIIARALPIQKTRIVTILQKVGHVVAMTGDGVNDAPALKKADVGIAMGTGTDVSKEVAKAILADDNFATIVNAIAEGRNIYDRILKSTKYLLACNVGEVTAVFFAVLMGFPLPLITMQILLMNLLTDGLPALGLGFEKAEDDVMKRSPRNPKHNPLTREMLTLITIFGIAMGLGTLLAFSFFYKIDLKLAQTVAFTTIVMFEMFAVMSARSFASFKKISPFSNKWLSLGILSSIGIQLCVVYIPFLQKFFGTVALGWTHWAVIIGISSFGFIMMEISKLLIKEKYADKIVATS